jgi:DNA repair protein RadA/Sms
LTAKVKTSFVCQQCGAQAPKWLGKCPNCGEWNSYVEEIVAPQAKTDSRQYSGQLQRAQAKALPLDQIAPDAGKRWDCPDKELHRVLGGGIVPGSLTLLGGEPGIGKSTLLLQLALKLTAFKILYISGEESEAQVRMRADRLNLPLNHCYMLAETETTAIFQQMEALQPQLVIVDSIQTMYSPLIESTPGSVSQIRQTAGEFMRYAKENQVPVFLVGHITKDGSLAGPKVLEHLVDTVLQFEGDRHQQYRIVRTLKNRFGSTSELAIYEMQGGGLREVNNPNELLLTRQFSQANGIAIGSTLEGNRSLFCEIQSLVSTSAYGTAQRSATGFDSKRLNMLLAVMDKRGGYRLGGEDVFLNIAGGLRVEDPSIDLAVCMSLASSFNNSPLSEDSVFAGEIGLGGEIRPVTRVDARIAEAARLGFKHIYVSAFNKLDDIRKPGIEIIGVRRLEDLLTRLF